MPDTKLSVTIHQRQASRLIASFVLTFFGCASAGQNLLYVKHPDKAPQLRIVPGMEITAIQYRDSTRIRGLVGDITPESVEINRYQIPYQWIDEIHYQNQLVFILGSAFSYAGIFAIVIPPINNSINRMPVWDRDYLLAGTVLIPTGLAIRKLSVKKFKKRKGYYWQYYNLE
ncbi:MAG: hypothetical protein ACK4KT_03225 [Thermaurantimonas sp.]